jgi:hypothetical protein
MSEVMEQSAVERLEQRLAGVDPNEKVKPLVGPALRTRENDPLGGAADADTCGKCGGRLAVISQTLRKAAKLGDWPTAAESYNVPDAQKEVGPDNKITDRAKRGVYWGCGKCRTPVPLEHPRQLQADEEWREVDERAAVKARLAKAAGPKVVPEHIQVTPTKLLEQAIDALRNDFEVHKKMATDQIAALRKNSDQQGRTILELQKALKAKV